MNSSSNPPGESMKSARTISYIIQANIKNLLKFKRFFSEKCNRNVTLSAYKKPCLLFNKAFIMGTDRCNLSVERVDTKYLSHGDLVTINNVTQDMWASES